MGIGIGVGGQQPLMASQTIFTGADIALSTSVLIFTQTLAGTVFISVAENVFHSELLQQLHKIVPDVDPRAVLEIGASRLHDAMRARYPDELPGILDAYNRALQAVFLISLVLSCLTVFGSVGMEWVSVKKPKQETSPQAAAE